MTRAFHTLANLFPLIEGEDGSTRLDGVGQSGAGKWRRRMRRHRTVPTDADDLATAIREFEARLPGWWWRVVVCGRTRDASCGPDGSQLPEGHPHLDAFDAGFSVDLRNGTAADALRVVTRQALDAIAASAHVAASMDREPEDEFIAVLSTFRETLEAMVEAACDVFEATHGPRLLYQLDVIPEHRDAV